MISQSTSQIPLDVLADARLIAECVAVGKPIPTEVVRRVREESERTTKKVYEEFGLLDIAVPAIRELRGELSEP